VASFPTLVASASRRGWAGGKWLHAVLAEARKAGLGG